MEGNRVLRIARADTTSPTPTSMHHWLAGVAELLSAVGGAVALADDAGRLLVMSHRLEDAVDGLTEPARCRWLSGLRDAICALRAGGEFIEWQAMIESWHTRFTPVAFPSPGHTVVRIELPRHACLPARLRELLSRRESDVAAELLEGHSSRIIAQRLGITVHTVRRMTERVFRKVGVHSRGEFTLCALGMTSRPRLSTTIAKPASRVRRTQGE